MFQWLIGSLLAGVPSGLGPESLEALGAAGRAERGALVHGLDTALQHLSVHPSEALADEALSLWGPLAEMAGLGDRRGPLEDAGMRVLDPSRWATLVAGFGERDHVALARVEDEARGVLADLGLPGEVGGRVKSIASTARKLDRKGLALEDLADRIAVRVRVAEVEDCYRVLDGLHARFAHDPNELDDYIRRPRPSGYQSLHTALWVPQLDGPGTLAEVQIRTHGMHIHAEHGDAAHWRYKLPV